MNDLEKILKEMREDRDIWREIVQRLQMIEFFDGLIVRGRKLEFEIREGDDVVADNLESLFKLVEGHGYVVRRGGL